MIFFSKLRWKNLLSTGNNFTEVQLDSASTTLVCGDNGAGKTTMLDALTFVLYGKSYRGINIPQIVNSINKKDCVVEIELTVNGVSYKICRGLAPKLFTVEKNGVMVEQTANVKDYQHILENQVLKMNFKTFCQVVILGSTGYIPFMRLSAADRRSIVENLLDIGIFSKMNDILKNKIITAKDELKANERELQTIRLKIEHKTDIIGKIEQRSDTQIDSYRSQKSAERSVLDGLYGERDYILADIKTNGVVSMENDLQSLQKMNLVSRQLQSSLKKTNEEVLFYNQNTECPVCSQEIQEDFRVSKLSTKLKRITEIQEAITKITAMVEERQTTITIQKAEVETVHKLERDVGRLDSKIESCKKYIQQLCDLEESTKAEKSGVQSEKDSKIVLESDFISGETNRKEMVENVHIMELVGVLLKDSGIKRKIIRKYIPALNKIVNKYLTSMDFFVHFSINEDFVEIIKSRHHDDFSYENFSEGEKLRIDLSLLLAWRDIAKLKNSANTNLLILDEVFDSSLDAVGTEEVVKILQNMSKNNNVFVISHKSDQMLDKFPNILIYKKVNNFSVLSTP